jgi:hypothetical protein
VFDDQHNLWTNAFASVCVYSSQDVIRCHTPDCPVHQGPVAPMASSRWHYVEKTTGLSGVKSLRANGRLQCQTNG